MESGHAVFEFLSGKPVFLITEIELLSEQTIKKRGEAGRAGQGGGVSSLTSHISSS